MENIKSVAPAIKQIVESRGLKQVSIAQRAGYTKNQFNSLLNGRKLITETDIFKICSVLEITPNELFGFSK